MGFYRDYLFPRLMDWVMAGEQFRRLRAELLASLHGDVLELGIGTGLNLSHYPGTVSSVTAVDPATLLPRRLAARSAGLPMPLRVERVTAESMPFPSGAFDYVVSTWTLCTIADPLSALREVLRVLKPTGRFVFLEHGRSDDATIAAWQDRLNPVQRVIGCGCNLNRPIDRLVAEAGLCLDHLDRFHMPHVPRVAGEMYRGAAMPARMSVEVPLRSPLRRSAEEQSR